VQLLFDVLEQGPAGCSSALNLCGSLKKNNCGICKYPTLTASTLEANGSVGLRINVSSLFRSIGLSTFAIAVLNAAVFMLVPGQNLWSQSIAEADVWTGIVSSRNSLVSGEYKAVCVTTYKNEDGENTISKESRVYCAFDELQSSFRFDRTIDGKTAKLVRAPDKTIIMGVNDQIAGILPASRESRISNPFDFKCMGLAFWPDLDLETPLEELIASYSDTRFKLVSSNFSGTTGIATFEWQLGGGALRRLLKVDTQRDYWPIHMEVVVKYGGSEDRTSRTGVDIVLFKVEEHWVPQSYKEFGEPGSTIEIDFEWLSLNRPIPESVFSASGLSSGDSVKYVDLRQDTPSFTNTADTPVAAASSGRYIFLAASATLLIFILIFVLRR
jgi:hypothetical protein